MAAVMGYDLVEYPDSDKVACSVGTWPNAKRFVFRKKDQAAYDNTVRDAYRKHYGSTEEVRLEVDLEPGGGIGIGRLLRNAHGIAQALDLSRQGGIFHIDHKCADEMFIVARHGRSRRQSAT